MTQSFVICRSAGRRFALRVSDVIEIMRPLASEPAVSGPTFVVGLSTIRGEPVPVVDLGRLLGADGGEAVNDGQQRPRHSGDKRFVLMRAADRRIALAVDGVDQVMELSREVCRQLPPLVESVADGSVAAIAMRDQEMVGILNGGHLLGDEIEVSPGGSDDG